MLKIPFSFLPRKIILGIAHSLKNFGGFLSAFFPGLHEELFQAQISESTREYAAITFTVAFSNALFGFVLDNRAFGKHERPSACDRHFPHARAG